MKFVKILQARIILTIYLDKISTVLVFKLNFKVIPLA